jgi:hypothetical protein
VTIIRVGVPWLSERDWPKWAEIDLEMLPYEVWRARADNAILDLGRRGIAPVKLAVEPRAFADWCRIAGKPFDRHSRCEYAAVLLRGTQKPA